MAGTSDRAGSAPALAVESLEIGSSRFPDFPTLEAEWRRLEAIAGDYSFFQSWTWVGCLAEERYPAPVLLRASTGGRTVGLALCNRRGRRLHLTASGDRLLDRPHIEHNAPLVAQDRGEAVAQALLRAAWRIPGISRVVLPGVPEPLAAATGGSVLGWEPQAVPFVDLDLVRGSGLAYLEGRSANTRAQIRRSLRRYEARGPVRLARAETPAEALAWLDALAGLHAATWQRRGRPDAFSHPFLRRFHETLVLRALARGELDLLRLAAGGSVVGYLYNFRLRGRISAYQSGFAYAAETAQEKPGLCLHAQAIERAIAAGERVYDFLAGDGRYKRSLANAETALVWADLARPGLRGRLEATGRGMLRRLRDRLGGSGYGRLLPGREKPLDHQQRP